MICIDSYKLESKKIKVLCVLSLLLVTKLKRIFLVVLKEHSF